MLYFQNILVNLECKFLTYSACTSMLYITGVGHIMFLCNKSATIS